MPARTPTRDHAIEFLLRQLAQQGLTASQASAIVASAAGTTVSGDATGSTNGVGETEITVQEIHGDTITPPALAADANDYAPSGSDALIWRIDPAGFAITGFAAPVTPGEVHLMVALSAGSLAHDDVGSAAGNRLLIPGGDLAMGVDDLAWAVYDGDSLAWRIGPMVAPGTGAGLTPASYTITNPTTDRTFDADSLTLDELADIVATLIDDLGGT